MKPTNLQQQLRYDLIFDEGNKPKPYRCTEGKLTIGIGHNLDASGLCQEAIDAQFYHDIQKCITGAFGIFGNEFDHYPGHVRRAVINMIYQMGIDGFSRFKATIRMLKEGAWSAAADNALKSLWARQTPDRAKRVTDLMRGVDRYGA